MYLEGGKLVALLLEASDDLAHQVALHAVRLDHDVSALHGAAKKQNRYTHTYGTSVKSRSCRSLAPPPASNGRELTEAGEPSTGDLSVLIYYVIKQ